MAEGCETPQSNRKKTSVSAAERFSRSDRVKYLQKHELLTQNPQKQKFHYCQGICIHRGVRMGQTLDEASAGAPRKSAFKANHRYPECGRPRSVTLPWEPGETRDAAEEV